MRIPLLTPRAPHFISADLPTIGLSSKVYLITGATTGLGLQLAKVLYSHHATLFLAGRNKVSGEKAIAEIQTLYPDSKGSLTFVYVDLADLSTVKTAAESVLSQAERLDCVWHNAGVNIPKGGETVQGLEVNLGVNAVAAWLLQSFLTPLMVKTAAMPETAKGSVRVIWVGSSGHSNSPPAGGILWPDIGFKSPKSKHWIEALIGRRDTSWRYGQSKVACIVMGQECAKRWEGTGVLSMTADPGWIKGTEIMRDSPRWITKCVNLFMYPIEYGSITYLFAGLAPQVSEATHNGKYILPWSRIGASPRKDINTMMPETGKRLWEYCEEVCKGFM